VNCLFCSCEKWCHSPLCIIIPKSQFF
jgi:hypothetical protein